MKKVLLAFLLAFVVLSNAVLALSNPAAVYCKELGYEYKIEKGGLGESGTCILPDKNCEEWNFLSGKCGKEYSYCAKHGYETKTVERGEAICVLNEYSLDKKSFAVKESRVGELIELERGYEKEQRNGVKLEPNENPLVLGESYNASDFSYWDWRDPPNGTIYNENNYSFFDQNHGWVTSVKNQGGCGSCWAFSSVGAVEAKYEINENESRLNPDLSEEYLVSGSHEDPYEWLYQDCCGGYMEVALNYTKYEGISDESCFPYVDASSCSCDSPHACSGTCTYNTGSNCSDAYVTDRCSGYAERLWTIGGANYSIWWENFTIEELKQWIIDRGPLSIAIHMESSTDSEGFIDCGAGGQSTHAVVLIGYNETGDNHTSYWILKNSWGTGWGQNGYFKIRFDDNCNVGDEVHYVNVTNPPEFKPLVQLNSPADNNETHYQKVEFNFTVYNKVAASTCDLMINNDIKNTTTANNGTPTIMSYTLDDDNYNWKINCWENNLGVVNSSETRNLSVSAVLDIRIDNPQNTSYNYLPISLNVTTDETAEWCGWNLNGTDPNTTMSGFGTTWYDTIDSSAQGTQHLYVYCNNTEGVMSSNTSVYFTYDSTPPDPSGETTSPSSPATYSSQSYQFNVTYLDAVSGVSVVWIEENLTGPLNNHSVSTHDGDEYYYDVPSLGVGTYAYRWFANDTVGNENSTSQQTYIVNKAPLQGSISGSGVTYPTPVNVTVSEPNSGDSNVNYTLWRNNTPVSSSIGSAPSGDTSQLAVGAYHYILNSSGGTNYTANSSISTLDITVNIGSTSIKLYLNGTEWTSDQIFNYPHPTKTNATVNVSSLQAQVNLSLNGTPVSNPYETSHDLGAYNYTGFFAGNENYTGSSVTRFLTIVDNETPNISNSTFIPSVVKPNSNLTIITKIEDDYGIGYAYVAGYNTSWNEIYGPQNLSGSGINWFINFNMSDKPQGTYYFNLTAFDISGNNKTAWIGNVTINQTAGSNQTFFNNSVFTINNQTIVNTTMNLTLQIKTLQEIVNGSLGIAYYYNNPAEPNPEFTPIGKYFEIGTSTDMIESLDWCVLKTYYTQEEITQSGTDENSLGLYYFNETSGNWSLEAGGVNDSENYVWGNTTHLSVFGIFGQTTTTSSTTSSSSTSSTTTSSSSTSTTTTTTTTVRSRSGGGGSTTTTTTVPTTTSESTTTTTTETTTSILPTGKIIDTPQIEKENPPNLIFPVILLILFVSIIFVIVIAVSNFAGKKRTYVPPVLEKWITENLKKGYKPKQLKKSLLESGWNPDYVNRFLAKKRKLKT